MLAGIVSSSLSNPFELNDEICTNYLYLFPKAFSCKEGEYLDMKTQECQKCAAGTYSLGTGVAFDEWDDLPAGFISHGISMDIGNIYTNCSK